MTAARAPQSTASASFLARLGATWRRLPSWSGAALAFLALVLTIVLYEYFALGQMNFIKPVNLLNVLKANSEVGILAVGMTLIIILGGIDLGVGSLLAIAGALGILALNAAAGGDNSSFGAFAIAIAISLGVGAAGGFLNGILIAWGRIAPFIATLGALVAYRSLARWVASGGQVRTGNEWYAALGKGIDIPFTNISRNVNMVIPLQVSWAFILLIGVAIIAAILLNMTRWGRYIIAIGCNETAARYAAIPVARIKIMTYTLMGLLAGVAALVHGSRFVSVNSAQAGLLYELDAIAAVVLGGTSMRGGSGTIIGTIFGVLTIGCIKNMMTILGIPSQLDGVVMGIIIIAAILLQRVGERR